MNSTIMTLPIEIIIEILERVDHETLLNVTLTCKLWKDLVERFFPQSLDLRYNIKEDRRCMDALLKSKRKYRIRLESVKDINSANIIMKRIGGNVIKLNVVDCRWHSYTSFAEFIECLPNIEHIIFFDTIVPWECSTEIKLPMMKRLRTLEMVESTGSALKLFENAQLETIKIKIEPKEWVRCSRYLADVLKPQQNLKSFALLSPEKEAVELFNSKMLYNKTWYGLTKLSLLNIDKNVSSNGLTDFLNTHGYFLRKLELGQEFSNSIYKLVLEKLKSLKSLCVLLCGLPKEKEFFKKITPNKGIQELQLMDSLEHISLDIADDFIGCLPNIKKLTMKQSCGVERLKVCASKLQKLEILMVNDFTTSFRPVRFPNLKKLYFNSEMNGVWDHFKVAHPDVVTSRFYSQTEFWDLEEYEYMLLDYHPACLNNEINESDDDSNN